MGWKCYVPNCKSGYQSSAEPVKMFKAPSETDRRELWDRAIGRADRRLGVHDYVCLKHFEEHFILRSSYYSEMNGIVILNVPKTPKLTNDAVPTIFPEAALPHKPRRKKKGSAADIDAAIARAADEEAGHLASDNLVAAPDTPEQLPIKEKEEPDDTLVKTETEATDLEYILPDDSPKVAFSIVKEAHNGRPLKEPPLAEPVVSTEVSHPFLTFSVLSDAAHLVQLPTKAWAVHVLDASPDRNVVFTELVPIRGAEPVQRKTLSVSPTSDDMLRVETFILRRPVECKDGVQASLAASVTDLSKKLRRFHEMEVCLGGPEGASSVGLECGYIDRLKVWRHNNCSLYCTGERCTACGRLC